jgi:hypothetical protein
MGRHLHCIIRPVLRDNVAMYARKLLLGAYPCLTELIIFILKEIGRRFRVFKRPAASSRAFFNSFYAQLQKLGHCLTCY